MGRSTNKLDLLDFFRNYIYLLKLPFLASLILNFSGIIDNMLLKFGIKSAQKTSIFPKKANFERSLFLNLFVEKNIFVFFEIISN